MMLGSCRFRRNFRDLGLPDRETSAGGVAEEAQGRRKRPRPHTEGKGVGAWVVARARGEVTEVTGGQTGSAPWRAVSEAGEGGSEDTTRGWKREEVKRNISEAEAGRQLLPRLEEPEGRSHGTSLGLCFPLPSSHSGSVVFAAFFFPSYKSQMRVLSLEHGGGNRGR